MADLIERSAAIEVASRGCEELRGVFGRIEEGLMQLPTADSVPVVRCKDCKHLNDSGVLDYCAFGLPHPDGFCSYGERKDGKDEEHGTD